MRQDGTRRRGTTSCSNGTGSSSLIGGRTDLHYQQNEVNEVAHLTTIPPADDSNLGLQQMHTLGNRSSKSKVEHNSNSSRYPDKGTSCSTFSEKKHRRRVTSKAVRRRTQDDVAKLVVFYACLALVGLLLMMVGRLRRQRHAYTPTFYDDGEDPYTYLESPSNGGMRRVNPMMEPEGGGGDTGSEEWEKRYHKRYGRGGGDGNHYTPKRKEMLTPDDVGDKSPHFQSLLKEFKELYPEDAEHDRIRLDWVKTIRKHEYVPIDVSPEKTFDNDLDCPAEPRSDYPRSYPTLDIINHWNPDDVIPPEDNSIYQGICVFHYDKPGDLQKAENYRNAEVPFVMRDDPTVLRSAQRWNHPDYLKRVMGEEQHRAEFSHSNHFMYWTQPRNRQRDMENRKAGWKPPTKMITMTYPDWLSKANSTASAELPNEADHWYFRLIGCGMFDNCDKIMSEWLFDDLDFFFPRKSLYIVKPGQQKGIHCRFGMKGVIAENHFDGSRNSIVVLGGERRYILSHPEECPNLALFPKGHPSARHSAVDWSNPNVQEYPQFRHARSNEIVLQAGDVLYLPTNWFHYIVSLGMNYQCNTRSGISLDYMTPIERCGFAQ